MRTALRIGATGAYISAAGLVCAGIAALTVRAAGSCATLGRLRATQGAVVLESEMLSADLYESGTRSNDAVGIGRRWTLLIVVSGQGCGRCGPALSAWEHSLDGGVKVRIRVGAAEPNPQARQFVERLESAGADAALWAIRDVSRFRVRTGVRLVPMAILLDSDANIRLAVSGIPSQRTRRAFRRMVLNQASEGAPALFEHNAGAHPIERAVSRLRQTTSDSVAR